MLRLTNLEKQWRRGSCAIVVLLAVFSLTVSVATRYCSGQSSSAGSAVRSVRSLPEHSSPERSRPRLTKTTADSMPPVVRGAVLGAPRSYPRIAPAEPLVLSFLLEESLYNRPPPSC
jgi:hypothetical protein